MERLESALITNVAASAAPGNTKCPATTANETQVHSTAQTTSVQTGEGMEKEGLEFLDVSDIVIEKSPDKEPNVQPLTEAQFLLTELRRLQPANVPGSDGKVEPLPFIRRRRPPLDQAKIAFDLALQNIQGEIQEFDLQCFDKMTNQQLAGSDIKSRCEELYRRKNALSSAQTDYVEGLNREGHPTESRQTNDAVHGILSQLTNINLTYKHRVGTPQASVLDDNEEHQILTHQSETNSNIGGNTDSPHERQILEDQLYANQTYQDDLDHISQAWEIEFLNTPSHSDPLPDWRGAQMVSSCSPTYNDYAPNVQLNASTNNPCNRTWSPETTETLFFSNNAPPCTSSVSHVSFKTLPTYSHTSRNIMSAQRPP